MARSVDDKMPFMEHLGELRVRIMRSLYAVLVGLVIAFPFSERITEFLMRPVTTLGHKLVFTAPAEAFWVQMKVALITGVFISGPACTSTSGSTRRRSSSSARSCSWAGAPSRCSW
jgi:sec-independent protein translocase protein TatC